MPPTRVRNKQNSLNQEGRILIAIEAIQNQSISSVTAAARVYNVPRSTLRGRVNGALIKPTTRGNRLKLTQLDEDLLTKWILSIDDRDVPPRPLMVRRKANILLTATSTDTIGKS